jgi:hypothetical protein
MTDSYLIGSGQVRFDGSAFYFLCTIDGGFALRERRFGSKWVSQLEFFGGKYPLHR